MTFFSKYSNTKILRKHLNVKVIKLSVWLCLDSVKSTILCSKKIKTYFCLNGAWEPNKSLSVSSIGGHMRPLRTRMKNKSHNSINWKTVKIRGSMATHIRDVWGCSKGGGRGVKVWLCRSSHRFPLSSSGRDPSVCYNRKRVKVKAQTYCLPGCVTGACLSYFPISV